MNKLGLLKKLIPFKELLALIIFGAGIALIMQGEKTVGITMTGAIVVYYFGNHNFNGNKKV